MYGNHGAPSSWIEFTATYYEPNHVDTHACVRSLTWRNDMAGMAQPPMKMTVVMAMTHVVVKKSCRTVVTVLRTASANAMAPRSPENHSMC